MSKKIVISSGHGLYVRGASGYIDEVQEARKITDDVARKIREVSDVEVVVYHDDVSRTVNKNLASIVSTHNKHKRDLDVSVHLNAASKTSQERGVEVLHYDVNNKSKAAKVSAMMASALKLKDRGAKQRQNLAFLRNTNKPALLLEVCFVDSLYDVEHYKVYYNQLIDALARALIDAVGGVIKQIEAQKNEKKEGKNVIKTNPTLQKESKDFIANAVKEGLLSDKKWVDYWTDMDNTAKVELLATILNRKFYK